MQYLFLLDDQARTLKISPGTEVFPGGGDEECRPVQVRQLDAHTMGILKSLTEAETAAGTCASSHEAQNALVDEVRRKTAQIETMQDALISSMAELVDVRHGETGGHVHRTAGYLEILARAMLRRRVYPEELSDEMVSQMIRSAPLHDIGKIGIPDSTLLKRGSLDEQEREYMKLHTTLGARAISSAIERTGGGDFLYAARDMAHYHHEWWNGQGYPDGISGADIPLCARIIAVADVYDALTSDRAYHKRLEHREAVAIILNARGTQFDPRVADVFAQVSQAFKAAAQHYHGREDV